MKAGYTVTHNNDGESLGDGKHVYAEVCNFRYDNSIEFYYRMTDFFPTESTVAVFKIKPKQHIQ